MFLNDFKKIYLDIRFYEEIHKKCQLYASQNWSNFFFFKQHLYAFFLLFYVVVCEKNCVQLKRSLSHFFLKLTFLKKMTNKPFFKLQPFSPEMLYTKFQKKKLKLERKSFLFPFQKLKMMISSKVKVVLWLKSTLNIKFSYYD